MMADLPYIDDQALTHRPTWQGVVDAIIAGHNRPKARIADNLLGRADQKLLNRAAWIDGLGSAVKSVTVYPDNPKGGDGLPSVQGACLVFDDKSGTPKAMIDSKLLTFWKTAADSVLGALLVGPKDPDHLVIVGAGVVAQSLAAAYTALLPNLSHITICARRLEAAENLINRLDLDGVDVHASDRPQQGVTEGDIIATATTSATPVLNSKWIKAGAHIDLVGAYTPTMREADTDTLKRGALYVDSRDTTLDHIGDLKTPLEQGDIERDDVLGDFYDLVPVNTQARPMNGKEITVFKNGGGAHLDLMVSRYLLDLFEGQAPH